jgi:hypothetical protein
MKLTSQHVGDAAPFKCHIWHRLMVKHHLLWWCWKCINVLFLMVRHKFSSPSSFLLAKIKRCRVIYLLYPI